ncbi:hypothetical protein QBC36DRAFT_390560 [Triangularia setosa]|uniref:Fungal N-terminal domain-containing protein n=1 Tax=Triangularia setosa TaxID=2587417 RepID=A0AAN6W202_9PEZI|nr:hypothetical protein QBC36DRAFT_390560 [Podospora setosa]
MDPFSITIGCFTLLEVAQKTIKQLFELSKRYHDARSDLIRVMTQLQSLTHVLELILYDEAKQRTGSDLNNDLVMDQANVCMDIIEELQGVIASINGSHFKWVISGKATVENIYKQLQTATEQLELILGVHTLTITKEVKNDTHELLIGQEHIAAQIKRLSEHVGLMDNIGPEKGSISCASPSWSRTSQGVYVETTEKCGPAIEIVTNIHESTMSEDSYTNDTPPRTNSSQWSGSTEYSPPAFISTPATNIEEVTHSVPPLHDQLVDTSTWSNYQHSAAAHTTFWTGQVQYSSTTMAHDTVKLSNETIVEHVETPARPPTPSKQEIIRNQFKQATWALATKKKNTARQKKSSVAESFKEMVRAASLKAGSIAT